MTNLTQPQLEELVERARKAAQHSYSPYSKFRVGAALQLTNGEIVTGTNVENVSYGLTICAERSALVRAVSQFGPEIRIAAVAVANLNGRPALPAAPAGRCWPSSFCPTRRWCFRWRTVCAPWPSASCCRWRLK